MSDPDLPYLQAINDLCNDQHQYIVRLLARIADLEAAGRLLGAEVKAWRRARDYPESFHTQADAERHRCSTDSHPTAAQFVKEAGDGH